MNKTQYRCFCGALIEPPRIDRNQIRGEWRWLLIEYVCPQCGRVKRTQHNNDAQTEKRLTERAETS